MSAPVSKRIGGTAHARDILKSQSAFSNAMLAEAFELAHTRGTWKVLPRTDGKFVLFDSTAPLSVPGRVFDTLGEAERALAKKGGGS